MVSNRDFRVGLIGYGLGGAYFHAPLIQATEGLRLTKVVTANAERRAQAHSAIPEVEVVTHVDELWRKASELDLIVIATPNRTHVPLAMAALDAGLAVVIDKPFALSSAEARQVVDKARARGLPLSAYHIRRWDSECLTLMALLERQTLGKVLRFESRLDRWRPAPKGSWKERGVKEAGGGLLYDIGSHLIDQALYLFGPVRAVYAELDRHRDGVESEDDIFVALTHQNGVHSHLWASVLAAQPGPRLRVMGQRASFVKATSDMQEAQLRAGLRPGGAGWGEEPRHDWGILSDGMRSEAVESKPGAYPAFYDGMVRTLRLGAPPPVAPEEAVRGLEILEAARRAFEEEQFVQI